eukprot:CAMPEP_0180173404 /NCGR_PEP_ID=MMETSP0986-20121125/35562_1 /TAXON_ID=697907 /ORGANISM="non described non described, Strain CCMP2293" /LENGTH=43 /DNA_ID= /DNA_START= /DNA_END= /DNA_ORIENTATION=
MVTGDRHGRGGVTRVGKSGLSSASTHLPRSSAELSSTRTLRAR